MIDKERAANFIKDRCIYRPESKFMHGKLVGTRYASQFYMADFLMDPDMQDIVCEHFYTEMGKIYPDFKFQIACGAWAGIPLISFLPRYCLRIGGMRVNAFMVREKRKTYGRNNIIEGTPNDLPVVAVSDVCNSTNALYHARSVSLVHGHKLSEYVYSVFNKYPKADQNGRDRVAIDAKTISLLDRDDVL